jgi:hypothetical protein
VEHEIEGTQSSENQMVELILKWEYYITYSGEAFKDSSLLGCDAVLLSEWFLTFQGIVVHSSSGSSNPRRTSH